MSGVNLTMTDLGGYSAVMTDAGTSTACAMTDAPRALPSVAIQASLGMSASAAMGMGALRPARGASLGMSASAAMGISADAVPAPASIALGAWVPWVAPLWSHDMAASYTTLVGKAPAIVHWYQDLAHTPLFNDSSDMTLAHSHGVVPMVTYELWDYTAGATQPAYTNAAILAGTYDAKLTAFAQAAHTWGFPFYFRPFHEFSGRWYPWACGPGNPNGNSTASLIAAWRHVWQIFRTAGATNAKFVWCPQVSTAGAAPYLADLAACYPGTQYVDYLGMDGYAWSNSSSNGPWTSFGNVFKPTYDILTTLGPQPLIIAETGVVPTGGDKAGWITDMGANAAALFPRLKAVVWFNSKSSATEDWRFNDTTDNLAAFQAVAASAGWSALLTP